MGCAQGGPAFSSGGVTSWALFSSALELGKPRHAIDFVEGVAASLVSQALRAGLLEMRPWESDAPEQPRDSPGPTWPH